MTKNPQQKYYKKTQALKLAAQEQDQQGSVHLQQTESNST
jgi:hypothetical protein